jgi:hypothetical protein
VSPAEAYAWLAVWSVVVAIPAFMFGRVVEAKRCTKAMRDARELAAIAMEALGNKARGES